MQIYLPPERRLEAAPATPTAAAPVATTAVVEAAVAAAPLGEDAGLGIGVKAHPGAGSAILSSVLESSGPGESKNQLKLYSIGTGI
jgi:hypothetical protein